MTVLLSSVFGPFGVDDAYGRKENKIELFHNQVTREQGVFSLRFHHQSFGLHLIATNLATPTTVLDFPSEARFVEELRHGYDYVGISFIVPNFAKARRMAELVRRHSPASRIVLGGHGTRIPRLRELIDCDEICEGEGVRFMRQLLGEPTDRSIEHPIVPSAFDKRVMGIPLKTDAAALVPGLGCVNACRFCATSHFFGKQYEAFFESGRQLFDVCRHIERETGMTEFFVMDENFLKRPERAQELARLMEEHGKLYRFGIFSSAETIAQIGVEFLARLGVTFLWIGAESKRDVFEKNRGIDIGAMVRELRDHGVSVLASGILFLEHHDEKTLWHEIEYLVGLESDFVQFMGLGPMPGTRLYDEYEQQGKIRHELPYEEWHGQHQIWFNHPNFSAAESARLLRAAFQYDYDTQGASLLRMCETALRGWRRLGSYSDAMMAKRRAQLWRSAQNLRPALVVLKRHAHNACARERATKVMAAYDRELGPMTLGQKLRAQVALLCAVRESWAIAAKREFRQPKTIVTRFHAHTDRARMPVQIPTVRVART